MGAEAQWARAVIALHLACADPGGLGGVLLRARAGPAREAFLRALEHGSARLHPAMPEDALFGGLDIDATLATGRIELRAGLDAHDGPLILPMAERTPPRLAARFAGMLDARRAHPLIALDESAGDEERVPPALADRLALHVDLEAVPLAAIGPVETPLPGPAALPRAQDAQIAEIAGLAEAFGVPGARAGWLALRAAAAHAALKGRAVIAAEDIELACLLVLAPRATHLPEPGAPPAPPQPEETRDPGSEAESLPEDNPPTDLPIEAVLAQLPEGMLARIAARKARAARGTGTGDARIGNRRGRPVPPRKGRLGGTARLDLVATLRAAAPWQAARGRPKGGPLRIRPADIHLRRYEQPSDRLLIFVVDASGSAAMTRLAEAKGAVELMLAAAYARRDHVALIAFRKAEAEVLLAPTRSLLRTKRQLAGLPGGGATPLARGLREALEMAKSARRRGMTPTLAILTDGRANIALDGTADRGAAASDALDMARAIRASGMEALVIDSGTRPEPALRALADAMQGHHFALPRADAGRISAAVSAALDA
ncbi:magnesium chelatase subunit D [Marivita sp. GX14005]|uniref:magnesium chelatase subunit D n=1 Tax=Marivita sp. GX14005 TaxID=2942276 RepID=UPI002018C273|nr:magnesium chelatase subunit D [Marivita sp. GX14005]MCL3883097.1 magnesium chelatase subunit D [Marivita sp. GX14005]